MPIGTQTQVNFSSGLNAQVSPHLCADGEVPFVADVDFGLENGAASARRGSVLLNVVSTATATFNAITRHYNGTNSSLDLSPWYLVSGNGPFVRGTLSAGTFTNTVIGTGASGGNQSFITSYQNYAYLANGSVGLRDDGTHTWNWAINNPTGTPLQVTPTGAPFLGFNLPFTIGTSIGTYIGSSTSGGIILTTATTGTGTGIVLLGTTTATNWENPTPRIGGLGSHTTIGTNSGTCTFSVGIWGVDYLLMGFTDPSVVTKISRDASVGDTTFTNYWHAETTLDDIVTDGIDIVAQSLGQANYSLQINTYQNPIARTSPTTSPYGVSSSTRSTTLSQVSFRPLVGGVMAWKVNRVDYQFIGTTAGSPDWTNIKAVRVVIETTDTCEVVIGGWQTYGDSYFCLTDTSIGYSYCYTLARLESGIPVAESGPSPFTVPIKCQNAQTQLLFGYDSNVVNGTDTTNGCTHIGIYRQGGVLNDAYLVDYFPLNWIQVSGTNTNPMFNSQYVDGGYPDVEIVNNIPLVRDLWGTWSGVSAVSEPWNDRIFLGSNNQLWWTQPGAPTAIQDDTQTTVSNTGDPVQGLIPWGPLVVVNQNSVYELDGTIFEGPTADWTLRRSGSRRGSAAPKTIIKTPKGIFLLGYDGMSLYYPGYGVDTQLDWVTDKIGDAWKGTASTDPAGLKSYRTPAFNLPYLNNACATYAEGRIYLAAPTANAVGTSTGNNAMFVLDLAQERVWVYYYPFMITSLYWDFISNRLLAGTLDGGIVQLERGLKDVVPSTGATPPVVWGVQTKTWTSPNDMNLEGASVESEASGGVVVKASIDSPVTASSTLTLGTLTNSTRKWNPLPLAGQTGNNLSFLFVGTQSGTIAQKVTGLQWSAVVQPPKVMYWKSDFDEGSSKGEKIWDCNFTELSIQGTGTVTGVHFVDNVPVMTSTYLGPSTGSQYTYGSTTGTNSGPVRVPRSWPNETYGNISYSTYTCGSGVTFQIFDTSNTTRVEPPRVNSDVSDRFQPRNGNGLHPEMEAFWHDVLTEMDCLGSVVLGTAFVDTVAVGTYTMSGSGRKGYNFALPSETYGNVVYMVYNPVGVGLFKRYQTMWNYSEEPTRALFFEEVTSAPESEVFIKTWTAELNCLGGSVVGNLIVDGLVVATGTFTGTLHKTYEVGTPNVTAGKSIKATYTSTTPFKRYKTQYEFEPKPYSKTTWLLTYKRPGGVTQLDMARFNSLDLEGTATVTSTWLADGVAVLTNTVSLTGREFFDSLAFPPGVRGYLFSQQLTATTPFQVWRSNLDIERVGVKGFSRVTYHGKPQEAET